MKTCGLKRAVQVFDFVLFGLAEELYKQIMERGWKVFIKDMNT